MDTEYGYTVEPPNGRGCGDERTEGDPYGCCGLSPWGRPIEHFVIDPARPIPWQRGVKILPRDSKNPDGVWDLVIFIGIDPKDGDSEGYPSAWSFLEECRHFGASRKLPRNLPFDKLTPFQSRMVFVHAKAIPKFEYKLDRLERPIYGCKKFQDWVDNKAEWKAHNIEAGWHFDHHTGHIDRCTFALQDLAYLLHDKITTNDTDAEMSPGGFRVEMPSFSFTGRIPILPKSGDDLKWRSGAFLALPLTHIETRGAMDPELKETIETAGFEVAELDY